MKKLIFAIFIALLSTAAFAQTQPTSTDQKAKLHCYFMKDNAMQECWGSKAMPMTQEATLKNGTKVSTGGEVTMKDGKKVTLKNGECILADNGKIGPFDKMHPKGHKMEGTKM